MKPIELEANKREILGRSVSALRRQGITPAHLFGSGIESLALQCATAELTRALARAGETRLINLKIGQESKPRPVLVRGVQRDPLTGKLLHVDLNQVSLEEKVEVEVPVVLVGTAPALSVKGNTLLQGLHTLTVASLPDRIPNTLEVDVTPLSEAGQAIRVKDISTGEGVTVLVDPEQVVAMVVSRPEEKVEEKPVAAEAPAKPEEAQPAEGKAAGPA